MGEKVIRFWWPWPHFQGHYMIKWALCAMCGGVSNKHCLLPFFIIPKLSSNTLLVCSTAIWLFFQVWMAMRYWIVWRKDIVCRGLQEGLSSVPQVTMKLWQSVGVEFPKVDQLSHTYRISLITILYPWKKLIKDLMIRCRKLTSLITRKLTTDMGTQRNRIEPHHEKACLCHMKTTKVQISLPVCTVWSAPLLFAA